MRGNFLYYFLWGVFCTKLLLFVYFCIKLYIYVDKLRAFSPYLLLFIKFCIYGLYIFVVINCTFCPLVIPPCALCYLEFCPLPFRTPPCVILNVTPVIPNAALVIPNVAPVIPNVAPVILNVAPVILNAVKNLFQILRSAQDDGRIFRSAQDDGRIYCFADDGWIFRFAVH